MSPTPNMQLDLVRIRELFPRHGTLVDMERAEQCECGSFNDEKIPDPNCESCNGIGWRYYEKKRTNVVMLNRMDKILIERYGTLLNGTIGISIPDTFRDLLTGTLYTQYVPAEMDKITCIRDKFHYSEILEKGKIHPISGITEEKALFYSVNNPRISQAGGIIYSYGTDYTLTNDLAGNARIINWVPGRNSPAEGEKYSLSYDTNPTYVILPDFPKLRREASRMIMTHVIAKQINMVDQFKSPAA